MRQMTVVGKHSSTEEVKGGEQHCRMSEFFEDRISDLKVVEVPVVEGKKDCAPGQGLASIKMALDLIKAYDLVALL